jgi:fructokinase
MQSMQSGGDGFRIGIDLGGTKIEAVALAADGGERHRRRVATPAHDYAAILESVRALVLEAERAVGARASVGVGVGTPGALSPTSGLLRNSNTACLNGKPLDRDLARAIGRPVRIANDANCFALSEATDGAGAGAAVVFGVILGTGTGGGVVVNQRVLGGHNAVAGEWGHNALPWADAEERAFPRCYCGKQGCVETFLSGAGLVRTYAAHDAPSLTARDVAERAARGEPAARAALDRYLDRLARALSTVINVLDPDVVVLGGGLSGIDALARELPERLNAYVFSDGVTTRVARALHGDASGVRGAAWLWPAEERPAP